MLLKLSKIQKIQKIRIDDVFDIIHHEPKEVFLDEEQNLIVNQVVIHNCHAGGVLLGQDLNKHMPLIKSQGKTQSPWSEGQNVRHLEPLGFVKFDILGIGTLRMFEYAISLIINSNDFKKIREYYDTHLHPDVINFDDQKVYEETFHKGNFAGLFQFSEQGIQHFAKQAKPRSLDDITFLSAAWRPGPLSIKINELYIEARNHPENIKYIHPVVKEVLEKNYGFIVYQEDLAWLTHKLGKDVSLEEGNLLRKVLTKKGTGKGHEVKDGIFIKYLAGCVEKGINEKDAKELWEKMEFFSQYGFNRCLTGDTIVIRSGANKIQPNKEITIKELFDAQNSDTSWGKKIRNIGIKILQYDNDGRCRPGLLKKIHFNGHKNVFEIKTTNNKTIKVSFNHRLLTDEGYKSIETGIKIGTKLICLGKEQKISKNRETIRARGKTYNNEGFLCGIQNPSFIDGRTQLFKKAKEEVFVRANNKCENCGKQKENNDRYEFAHLSLEHKNKDFALYHSINNLKYLCNNCHKKLDYDKQERKPRWYKGIPSEFDEVISITFLGKEDVFDIEMNNLNHNFVANRIISHNSHALCYSVISFQCAWLLTYYPKEWLCAWLENEPDETKEHAISNAKSFGYNISPININTSNVKWEPSNEPNTLIQPLSSIKGLGEKAIEQIVDNRPFNTIEDLLFNDKIKYQKLNKKGIDVLIRSGACDLLCDKRFNNNKHFWMSMAFDRPKTMKKFEENIEKYKNENDFTDEEKINNIVELTGIFPISIILEEKVVRRLNTLQVPGINNFDPELQLCWFIIRDIEIKKTKNNKEYLVLKVLDNQCKIVQVKCWGYIDLNVVKKNKVYVSKLKWDATYGFSINSIKKDLKMIG